MKPAHLLEWTAQLKARWCEALDVTELRSGGYTVSTPFLQRDGDGLTVIARQTRDGWELRDEGVTVSHLDYSEFDLTETRRGVVERLAAAYGATLEEGTLRLHLDARPTAEDIADFIQLSAQVIALPISQAPRAVGEEQFRTQARAGVRQLLADPSGTQENWHPPQDHRRLYPADLLIPSGNGGVASFYAAGTQKAESSIATLYRWKEWHEAATSILVHDGTLSSNTLYRAQDAFQPENVVGVNLALTTIGPYQEVRARLRALDVDLQAA